MSWRKLLTSKGFLLLLCVTVAFLGYFFAKELRSRYRVEQDIRGLQEDITNLEKGNQELTNLIEYFRSTSYQEKELRRKLNLQRPGEHVVSLPEDGGLARSGQTVAPPASQVQPNWEKWWNYFFRDQ